MLRDPAEAIRRVCHHGISPGHGSAPVKDAFRLGVGQRSPVAAAVPSVLLQLAAFVRRKGPYLWQAFFRRGEKRACRGLLSVHRAS
jgi:hypothetical protein